MIGTKMTAMTSMTKSVWCEEDEFQTVSDDLGSIEEGRMNGNIVSPAEAMMPVIDSFENSRVETSRPALRPRKARIAPTKPRIGATAIQGRSE